MEVQEFETPILISSFIKMKHYSVFLGPQVLGIYSEYVSVFFLDVPGDRLS